MTFSFFITLILFLYGYYMLEKSVIRKRHHFRQSIFVLMIFILLSLVSSLVDSIPKISIGSAFSATDSLHLLLCVPITVFGILLVLKTVYHIPLRNAYRADIITLGIVYGFYLLMNAVCAFLFVLLKINVPSEPGGLYYFLKIIPVVMIAPCLFLLFHVKRFRSGMPFLKDSESLGLGTWIALFLIVITNFAFVNSSTNTIIVLFTSASFVCPFILLFLVEKKITEKVSCDSAKTRT